jgi:hypothetical protein
MRATQDVTASAAAKPPAAAATMDGPAGVSTSIDKPSPASTAATPSDTAISCHALGRAGEKPRRGGRDDQHRRDQQSRPPPSAPPPLSPPAPVSEPAARARGSGPHFAPVPRSKCWPEAPPAPRHQPQHQRRPHAITARSPRVTVKISPNRKADRSTRTLRQERNRHQPNRQRRMRQHAQSGVHRPAPPRQNRDDHRHRQRRCQGAGKEPRC